ncbi:sortase [Pasteuria penetrans]|uniref:sortase n=1 Tax=Pasteuria penetrans TaxID=86005 RepID=UPI000FB1BD4E|nr:sortase [Pasteuria penetrans]
MIPLIKKIALVTLSLSLGVCGYYVYRMWSERENIPQSSDIKPYDNGTTQDPQNGTPDNKANIPTINVPTMERGEKAVRVGKATQNCPKVAELTLPGKSKKIYNLLLAQHQSIENTCLHNGPIVGTRSSKFVLPGKPGLSFISGHRDTQFRDLKNVEKGDYAIFDDGTKKLTYQVHNYRTVRKEAAILRPIKSEQSVLWITTCYPFYYRGDAPYRRIFELNLVREEESAKGNN